MIYYDVREAAGVGCGWTAHILDSGGWSRCATFQPADLEWLRAWVASARYQGMRRVARWDGLARLFAATRAVR